MQQLRELQREIASLKFLDPACGCGNFLIVTYQALRRLENEIIAELCPKGSNAFINIDDAVLVSIEQFYGIEIEDWPCEIAKIAMWLTLHKMNVETAKKFGDHFPTIPLKSSVHICNGNALTLDWNEVLSAFDCSYILGNPPFAGTGTTSNEQKQWLKDVYPAKERVINNYAFWQQVTSTHLLSYL